MTHPAPWLKNEVTLALAEDIGTGDVSAELIPAQQQASAHIICREPAVMCGQAWLNEVFQQLDPKLRIDWHCNEGDEIPENYILCHLEGNARTLLTGERTALNFLQTLMGTATTTRRYVRELNAHGMTKLLDTRKTLPGLRMAQKYAVRIGGGVNHRIGLFDAILIKENHIMAAGSMAAAVHTARQKHPHMFIEVEVETLEELARALTLPVQRIMLDNFSLHEIRQAVAMAQGKIPLEASGNVTFENLFAVGQTGVDFISTGAITKHLHAIDLSMRFTMDKPNA
jgi:nicotinate-nucleotide pyrophosphorylase (carboxylating)